MGIVCKAVAGDMALVGEELASDAMLDKVLCIFSGGRPIKPCTDGLANKGPSCSVVTSEAGMNFSQELRPFLLGDTSLQYASSAFLIKLSPVDFVGLRAENYAACLILIFGEFVPIEVG